MSAIDQIQVFNTGLSKEQISTAFSNALNMYDYVYNKTETDGFLALKVNKETGKGLSSNDYSDDDKALVEGAFGHGTDLENGEDLDDISDPGAYYASLTTAAQISNAPVATAFRLEVIRVSRLLTIQKVFPLPFTGSFFIRSCDSPNWSSWFEFTGSAVS
ncbi:MAG: hypothetical protein J6Y64_03785 [Ruminococcus sp.]|nr:hypothetical protein [Ruminococcus sp.]